MTTTEIIYCLQELRKNAVVDGCVSPKITIINNVKPDSFDWVISEAIQALEKSIITKSTDFDDIWDF